MKIAIIVPPGNFNIGNTFIEKGAEIMIRRVFKEHEIHLIEALEVGNNNFAHPFDSFTEYNKQLMNSCDWLFVLGGSCLSKYLVNFFESVKKLKAKKVLLGVGFYEGIEKELPLHKELPEHFEAIFTRDFDTYEALRQEGKYTNIYSGIDMAFWMDEYRDNLLPIENNTSFSVVNIDSPERGALEAKLVKENEDVILVRNNPSRTNLCSSPTPPVAKCFVASNWYEYIRLFATAKLVCTNRVHTFLACILFDIPCQVFMDYSEKYERFFLFNEIGLTHETERTYTKEDYSIYKKNLFYRKTIMEEQLIQLVN